MLGKDEEFGELEERSMLDAAGVRDHAIRAVLGDPELGGGLREMAEEGFDALVVRLRIIRNRIRADAQGQIVDRLAQDAVGGESVVERPATKGDRLGTAHGREG